MVLTILPCRRRNGPQSRDTDGKNGFGKIPSLTIISHNRQHSTGTDQTLEPDSNVTLETSYTHRNSSRKAVQRAMEGKSMKVMNKTKMQNFQCGKV
jgi:hypothetical protein